MNQPRQDTSSRKGSGRLEHFFREIEIQFLIHELKDPIAIIETGLRILLEKKEKYGPLTTKQENTLKRTLRNTQKARTMLSDLLEVGRSESSCFICSHFQPTRSVFQALKDALEIMTGPLAEEMGKYDSEGKTRELLSRNGIVVEFSSQLAGEKIFQDETKFRQIAGNLFKNALHHRRSRVEIKMEIENDYLVLAVSDDGPGVQPEHQEMIFRRYAQVKECAVVSRKGHGLGLAGALILARSLGGDINIDSPKGKGATFRLKLPLKLEGTAIG
jgi:signal transduction histidine kinase